MIGLKRQCRAYFTYITVSGNQSLELQNHLFLEGARARQFAAPHLSSQMQSACSCRTSVAIYPSPTGSLRRPRFALPRLSVQHLKILYALGNLLNLEEPCKTGKINISAVLWVNKRIYRERCKNQGVHGDLQAGISARGCT